MFAVRARRNIERHGRRRRARARERTISGRVASERRGRVLGRGREDQRWFVPVDDARDHLHVAVIGDLRGPDPPGEEIREDLLPVEPRSRITRERDGVRVRELVAPDHEALHRERHELFEQGLVAALLVDLDKPAHHIGSERVVRIGLARSDARVETEERRLDQAVRGPERVARAPRAVRVDAIRVGDQLRGLDALLRAVRLVGTVVGGQVLRAPLGFKVRCEEDDGRRDEGGVHEEARRTAIRLAELAHFGVASSQELLVDLHRDAVLLHHRLLLLLSGRGRSARRVQKCRRVLNHCDRALIRQRVVLGRHRRHPPVLLWSLPRRPFRASTGAGTVGLTIWPIHLGPAPYGSGSM